MFKSPEILFVSKWYKLKFPILDIHNSEEALQILNKFDQYMYAKDNLSYFVYTFHKSKSMNFNNVMNNFSFLHF